MILESSSLMEVMECKLCCFGCLCSVRMQRLLIPRHSQKHLFIYQLTNREALAVLCSVIKHAGSG